jgi:hypothetical protein
LNDLVLGGATVKIEFAKLVSLSQFDSLSVKIKDSLGNTVCSIVFGSGFGGGAPPSFLIKDRGGNSLPIFYSGAALDPASGSVTCHVNTTMQTVSVLSDEWEFENNIDVDISDGEPVGYLDVKAVDFWYQSAFDTSSVKDMQVSALTVSRLGVPFDIEELIFDGAAHSPDVPEQGADMHSCVVDGKIIYPYADMGVDLTLRNKVFIFDPDDNSLVVYPLAVPDEDACTVYDAVLSSNPATPNIIWLHSTYGTRALWWFNLDTKATGYIRLNDDTSAEEKLVGSFGGKIISIMIGAQEHIVSTSTLYGKVVAYKVSDGTTTELVFATGSQTNHYGIQTDGVNIFLARYTGDGSGSITAFQLSDAHAVSNEQVVVTTDKPLDIAWDGTYIWAGESNPLTTRVEQFEPIIPVDVVTGWVGGTYVSTHPTGSPQKGGPASIKANEFYVVAPWESHGNEPETIGWSILNRATGEWSDFWNTLTQSETPEGIWPFTGQYWPSVCVVLLGPSFIITGYSGDEILQPNASMRMLKFTRK